MTTAPVLFISHGAPTFALEPGQLGPLLGLLGKKLSDINAVLVVSPHWQTHAVQVMAHPAPATIHDFGGFSPALYDLSYPVAGHPQLATDTMQLLKKAGLDASLDEQRGLDHGAWVPLMHLLPEANIPVFQVSMPVGLNTATAFRFGQVLSALRQQGVLILASGSMTHNLYEVRMSSDRAAEYVLAFTDWVRSAVRDGAKEKLIDYRQLAPEAQRAHPTEEHFLPLLVALGAAQDAAVQVIDGGVSHSVLSMESYVWGLNPDIGSKTAAASITTGVAS
ncbi:DODA-type extradiol aromatic ring-opening family dioxygenase [Undibacterium sp. SXout7W]|uniref:DODA-type extradiol aromatic ring-opening family dioxygenase n=1 Tax=Undibacterium sp. SXout7W TaxID=3413049 RepID=UPI003BF21204